jgi:hypothetical protein
MARNSSTSPTRAKTGEPPAVSVPANADDSENTASNLIEAPVAPEAKPRLRQHDFPDGGGSGGAEAYRRRKG